jgi:hypothetical protein
MFRSEKIHLDSKNLVTEKLVTKPGDGNVIALTRNKRVNGNIAGAANALILATPKHH